MNPKVFISHASEDKERFVLNFATKLRAKGIDAWLDKWEILPGDSLIDKLFEEGIKNAQAVIVVVSNFSVNKPWVREELNAAVVKKINNGSKLIPVVIDDCEVPEALQSTVWVKIKDVHSYEAELESIVRAIYDHREKPPIGSPPTFVKTIIDLVPGLSKVDSLILKLACEEAIERKHLLVDADGVWERTKSFEIPEEEFHETLEILHSRGFIKGQKYFDGTDRFHHFSITAGGFESYAKIYTGNYNSVIKAVGLQIVNQGQHNTTEIAASLSLPLLTVNHIVRQFKNRGWIKTVESTAGDFNIYVFADSPELKRRLRES
jgi:predicted transcriptional regulator